MHCSHPSFQFLLATGPIACSMVSIIGTDPLSTLASNPTYCRFLSLCFDQMIASYSTWSISSSSMRFCHFLSIHMTVVLLITIDPQHFYCWLLRIHRTIVPLIVVDPQLYYCLLLLINTTTTTLLATNPCMMMLIVNCVIRSWYYCESMVGMKVYMHINMFNALVYVH